ncbi:thioredoxin [Brevundimonas sp. GN22]
MASKNKFAAMSRRAAITAAALSAMVAMAGCSPKAGGAAEGDMALGAAEGAKVTVVEYASVTCGHCAVWNQEVWPEFKAKYVDTNKVRFIFREFPTPPQDIAAAGFMLARCAGNDKYFDVVHAIMASQQEWAAGVPPRQSLNRIAQGAGMSAAEIETCLNDKDALAALEKRIRAGIEKGVSGTPAFYVNDQKIVDSSLSSLSAAVDAELAK